ncbi:MAG: hypothetical protein V4696_07465 [Pseudomonadota bacterium]
MGLFSFVGGLIGAGKSKKASRLAERDGIAYLDKALGEQTRQYDQTRTDYAPYREAGTQGLAGLEDLIGTNGPEAQAAALQMLQNSPELAQTVLNGENAIRQNASASGGLRGGNFQDGISRFRGDAFSQMIQQQLSRLGGLAGMGIGATDSVSAFGANKANQVSNIYGQQGDIRQQGLLTRGGINAQMWSNAGSFLDDSVNKIAKFFSGGGG